MNNNKNKQTSIVWKFAPGSQVHLARCQRLGESQQNVSKGACIAPRGYRVPFARVTSQYPNNILNFRGSIDVWIREGIIILRTGLSPHSRILIEINLVDPAKQYVYSNQSCMCMQRSIHKVINQYQTINQCMRAFIATPLRARLDEIERVIFLILTGLRNEVKLLV